MRFENRRLEIKADAIHITGNNDVESACLQLKFLVGDKSYKVIDLKETDGGFIGTTEVSDVFVEILFTTIGISVELKGPFSLEDSVTYFSNSKVSSQYGRAFVPDSDCRLFETKEDEEFYLTNSGMILQEKVGKNDLWMIAPPPHVFAFGDGDLGWWGLSIPEVMPVVYTKISCNDHIFNLCFHNYSPVHKKGRMPRVFIDLVKDSKEILHKHAEHACDIGLIDMNKKVYSWWHNPVYCTWGDQCYIQKTAPRKMDDTISNPLDETLIMKWADGIRSIYPGEVNYILDAGWFDYLGDYDPKLSEFKTIDAFKRVLDQLKAKGFRTILWYTPFWVQTNSKVEKEHPEYLVYRLDGKVYRDKDNRAFLDFSNPAVREYTKGRVEYLLNTLDADGFKIDMNYVFPLMTDVTLHDPSWGYGNHFWLEVLKFFHKTATNIKEDAFFTISGIESYLQPFASSVRLNDLFDMDNPTAWYKRAEMVSCLMPDVPIDVDGWPSSLEKMREYQFVSPVFGAPVTYYIDAVDIMAVKLTEIELNRIASVWNVYGKAPCEEGMQLTIDSDNDVFERRDANGNLKAVALQKSVLVCYAENHIYVTANCNRAVSITVEKVYSNAEKVYRDGRREAVNIFRDKDNLLINVNDSGSGILYYEIY